MLCKLTRRAVTVIAVGLALNATLASAQTQVFNVTRDFTPSSQDNPNGAWTYGYIEPTSEVFVPYYLFTTTPSGGGSIEWSDPNHLTLNAPLFWKNLSGGTVDGVANGQVSLHPGPSNGVSAFGDASLVRFTAPSAGAYKVRARFYAGDSGQTEAWVVKNYKLAQPLVHFAATSENPQWTRTLNLKAGATLEFIVGHSPDGFFFDNTPLSVVITKQ